MFLTDYSVESDCAARTTCKHINKVIIMYEDKEKTIEKPEVPLECPPRENKTITEPVEDVKSKMEF